MTRPPLRDYGTALTVPIIRHPETRRIITAASDQLQLGPLDEAMIDQIRTITLAARLAGVRIVDPAGTEAPNPFGLNGWWPDPAHRWVAALVAEGLRRTVRQVADDLVATGVPVDPESPMDLVVVVELLVLAVDWSRPAAAIAADLQPPAPWAVSEDGRTLIVRADLRGQAERDATMWRRQAEATARKAGRATLPSASYAGGKTRQTSEQVRRRRAALAAVLKRWPDIGAEELRMIGGRPTPSTAVFLAELAASGRPWRPEDLRSHRRALRDDLAFLRRQTTEQDHNG